MRYRLLGNLGVRRDDGVAVEMPAPKRRALLAILLLQRGQPISRERLIELLWGENAPDSAEESLFAHVSRLRRDIGKDRIRSVPGGYLLAVREEELDVLRFERDVEAGRRALAAQRWADASGVLAKALGQWQGSALADFAEEPFAQPEITRLEQLRDAALEGRIDADLELGRHAEVVPDLERLVKVYPLRERLWAQLMVGLYRSGRQSDALDRFQQLRTLLDRDLGIDPSPELQDLQGRILRQDSALALSQPVRGSASGVPPVGHLAALEATPASTAAAQRQDARFSARFRLGGLASVGIVSVAVVAIFGSAAALRPPAATAPAESPGVTGGAAAPTDEAVERILFTSAVPRDPDVGCDAFVETRSMIVAPDGGTPIRVSRGGDVFEHWASWSPDGTRIAFMGEGAEFPSLYVMQADGSALIDLLPSRPPAEIPLAADQGLNWIGPLRRPAWALDGNRIVFTYAQGGVWSVGADGSDLRQILADPTFNAADMGYAFGSPTVLPDGRVAVEVTEPVDELHGWTRLYTAGPTGEGFAPLAGMPDGVSVSGATWATDGTLAFRGAVWLAPDGPEKADLYLLEPNGTPARIVPGTSGIVDAPAWSPDGSRLAFTAQNDLHTIARDGSDRRTIVSDPERGACGVSWARTTTGVLPVPPSSPPPGGPTGPEPYHRGFLDPGPYVTTLFQPRLELALGPNWYGNRNSVDSIRIDYTGRPLQYDVIGYILVGRVQVVKTSPCTRSEGRLIGPTAAEFIEYVAEHAADPYLEATNPSPVGYGGRSGLALDLRVAGALTDRECPGMPYPFTNFHALFEVGDREISLRKGDRMRIVSLDVGDGPAVTFLIVAPTNDFENFTDVPDGIWEAFLDAAQPVLDSLSFE